MKRFSSHLASFLGSLSVLCFIQAENLYGQVNLTQFWTHAPPQSGDTLVNGLAIPNVLLFLNYYNFNYGIYANSALFLRLGIILVCSSMIFLFGNRLSIKLNLIPNLVILNLSYLATSHALPGRLFQNTFVSYFVAGGSNVMPFTGLVYGINSRTFWDLSTLLSLGIIGSSVFWLYAKNPKIATLRSIQVISLILIPLGLEIYVFDNSEFNMYIASTISNNATLNWFTNADLLWTSLIVFAIVTAFNTAARLTKEAGRVPIYQT